MWPHRSLWRATWLFLGFQQPRTLPRKSTSIPLPAHGCCLLWLLWLLVDQTSDLSEVPLEQALLLLHGIPILARNAPKPKAEEVLLKPSLRRESRRRGAATSEQRGHGRRRGWQALVSTTSASGRGSRHTEPRRAGDSRGICHAALPSRAYRPSGNSASAGAAAASSASGTTASGPRSCRTGRCGLRGGAPTENYQSTPTARHPPPRHRPRRPLRPTALFFFFVDVLLSVDDDLFALRAAEAARNARLDPAMLAASLC